MFTSDDGHQELLKISTTPEHDNAKAGESFKATLKDQFATTRPFDSFSCCLQHPTLRLFISFFFQPVSQPSCHCRPWLCGLLPTCCLAHQHDSKAHGTCPPTAHAKRCRSHEEASKPSKACHTKPPTSSILYSIEPNQNTTQRHEQTPHPPAHLHPILAGTR
jgi:hypothetical protein